MESIYTEAAEMSVLELILSSYPYLRSALALVPLHNVTMTELL